MHSQDLPRSEIPVEPAQPRAGLPIGRVMMLVIVAALVVWTAVRIRSATTEQARLLEERNQAADAAKKEHNDKPLVLRAGVATTWTPVVRIEGTLQPAEEADLGFKIAGRIHSVRAQVGDYVKRGQVLATLEQMESTAALDQMRAQVRAAEAQLKLAEDSETRTAALVKSGAGSAQVALQTREQRALAAAQADAARASVAMAQANMDASTLVAPFSGYVTRGPAGAGQVVNTMNAALFHVQNTSELKLVGSVSEAAVSLVKVGQAVRVVSPDGNVDGTVTAVLGSVDPMTRRVPVLAKVPNDPKKPLLAGSYVRAEVEAKASIPVLQLPAGAIRPGSQNEVMVADHGHMIAKRVVFHPAPDGAIYVRAGLDATDLVVIDASPEAKDGDTIPATAKATP